MFGKSFTTTFLLIVVQSLLHAEPINFEKQVWPILESKCVQCHKAPYEEKGRMRQPKAGLRLDGAWAISLGGEGGAVVKAGDSNHSELYYRTNLPEDDDDFMPPTGKADPLTKEEKSILAQWIDQGVDFGGWEGDLTGKSDRLPAKKKVYVSEIQEVYKQLGKDLKPLEESAWASITEAGGRVMPMAKSSPLLAVDFRLSADDTTDVQVQSIGSIADQVVHLDLSKTQITDQALLEVAKLKRLVRLDLHKTEISDAELQQLKGLNHLRYLNLYGTQVSDAGLQQLHSLKSLRLIYLWDSKATRKGAAALGEAIPELKISIK